MNIPKIQRVHVIDDLTLIVLFANKERKRYDVSPLLDREMFTPLNDPAFFKNVHVEPGGHAVVWNSDIDISEYELWKHGVDIP